MQPEVHVPGPVAHEPGGHAHPTARTYPGGVVAAGGGGDGVTETCLPGRLQTWNVVKTIR